MITPEFIYIKQQSFFSGDSINSPLLAVFSGLMYKDGYSVKRIPEIVAQSGSALLHFYSDVAYNMTGFNISYRFVFISHDSHNYFYTIKANT